VDPDLIENYIGLVSDSIGKEEKKHSDIISVTGVGLSLSDYVTLSKWSKKLAIYRLDRKKRLVNKLFTLDSFVSIVVHPFPV
jgi:hypothetical protein